VAGRDRAAQKDPGEEPELLRVIGQEFARSGTRTATSAAPRSSGETKDLRLEDLIVDEEMVVTVSHTGTSSGTRSSLYRTSGAGARKVAWDEGGDFVSMLFIADAHLRALLLDQGRRTGSRSTNCGSGRASKGRAIVNLLSSPRARRSPRSSGPGVYRGKFGG